MEVLNKEYQVMLSGAIRVISMVAVLTASSAAAVFNITPADSIQATVNAAANGDTIALAAGTYNQIVNLGNKQVTLAGAGIGQTIVSAASLNWTVLQGVGIGAGSGGLVVRDMTIRDGASNFENGGGLYLLSSAVRLERVRFENNHAEESGGGVYALSCAVSIIDCQFIENSATFEAGGCFASGGTLVISGALFSMNDASTAGALYLAAPFSVSDSSFLSNVGHGGGAVAVFASGDFASCSFIDNSASAVGGAVYRAAGLVEFTDATFLRNAAVSEGGAVYAANSGGIVARRSTFVANTALNWGGAVRCASSAALELDRCAFYGNRANRGGAVVIAGVSTIENSVFVANDGPIFGGALYSTLPLDAFHCTFYGNTAGGQAIGAGVVNGGTADLLNCIVWGNTPTAGPIGLANNWTAKYSDMEMPDSMALHPGTGNINAMPQFVALPSAGADTMWGTEDDDYGDLRLAPGSPGIDAGDSPSVTSILEDFNGDDRNLDDPATANTGVSLWALCVDMGAFEREPEPPAACQGDANASGAVNFDDITAVIANWQSICP